MTKWQEDRIKGLVKSSDSISDVLRKLGLTINSGNFRTFHKYIELWSLDISHFTRCASWQSAAFRRRPLKDFLKKGSRHRATHLKNRLVSEELLKYVCDGCGISDWKDKPLALHLDHINGDASDNRLENLRLLCPNCHSQTSTYAGRNIKHRAAKPRCEECGIEISKGCKHCRKHARRPPAKTKIQWPPAEQVLTMVEQTSYVAVGRELGVSDVSVRKHLKRNNMIP